MTLPSYSVDDAGKWVPEELRAYTKHEEEDKPYVPPAYYGEDEEQQLDSEDDELNHDASSSELEETSQPQDTCSSNHVPKTQETSSKVEHCQADSVSSREQSSANESRVRNRRKTDRVEDVVTVRKSDESCGNEGTSTVTNFDEDASTASSSSSGVIFVSNSRDGTSSSWSRYQQKQLEWALVQYPKLAKERWENIAKAVPGKTKVRNRILMHCTC